MQAPWSRSRAQDTPTRRREPAGVPWRGVTAVVALALVLLVALLPSPYVIERPGPVYDTLGVSGTGEDRAPLIEIPDERTYPTEGRLDLLTVSVLGTPEGGRSWLELAVAWLDPAQGVVPAEAVYPTGVSQEQANRRSAQDMTASQRSAVTAALTELGYDVEGDVRVTEVRSGSAAAGRLEVGDVVRSFAGEAVDDACALQNDVLDNGSERAALVVERDGEQQRIEVVPRSTDVGDGTRRPILGVATAATFEFPFTVRLRIDDVGGPSAGLMFALGVVDKLTPGALTGGAHVAGTGTICGDGAVGPIGGIVQKMHAARNAGATMLLAPAGNCDEVVGRVPQGLRVVPVGTLQDALEALERVREPGPPSGLPVCGAPVESAG